MKTDLKSFRLQYLFTFNKEYHVTKSKPKKVIKERFGDK